MMHWLLVKLLSKIVQNIDNGISSTKVLWVYAETCGLILAFLGSGGRNAATIFSLR